MSIWGKVDIETDEDLCCQNHHSITSNMTHEKSTVYDFSNRLASNLATYLGLGKNQEAKLQTLACGVLGETVYVENIYLMGGVAARVMASTALDAWAKQCIMNKSLELDKFECVFRELVLSLQEYDRQLRECDESDKQLQADKAKARKNPPTRATALEDGKRFNERVQKEREHLEQRGAAIRSRKIDLDAKKMSF
jgi:hypothetical protein